MKQIEFELARPDIILKGTAWIPNAPLCAVLIEHGMAEHCLRYSGLAQDLANQGVVVYAYDKRGHGRTAGLPDSPEFTKNAGWLAAENGWQHLVGDCLAMIDWITAGGLLPGKNADTPLPLFLFGHSMGSFLVRSVLVDPNFQRSKIAGCILSGTAGPAGIMGGIGAVLTAAWVKLHGAHQASPFLDKLFVGNYAGKATGLAKPRTVFEWISTSIAEVDQYIADPYCGMVMRTSFYRDLIGGLAGLFARSYKRRFPLDMPILMLSGEQDPVGGMGKGVRKVYADYIEWGVRDVQIQLFPGNRHEVLHDTSAPAAQKLISTWIMGQLAVFREPKKPI